MVNLLDINRQFILNDNLGVYDSDLFDFYDNGKTCIKDIEYYKSNLKKNIDDLNYQSELKKVVYVHTNINGNDPNITTTDKAHMIPAYKGLSLIFSEHLVFAPNNSTKPLPAFIFFHGSGGGSTARGYFELLERREQSPLSDGSIQFDGVAPRKTFGELYGYVVIYMNGNFGYDTNTRNDLNSKYRSEPWWMDFDINLPDMWEFISKVSNEVCAIDMNNVNLGGLSAGGPAINKILRDINKQNYDYNNRFLFKSIALTVPAFFELVFLELTKYAETYYNLYNQQCNFIVDIGSKDSSGIGYPHFKNFMDNFWDPTNTDRYNVNYIDNLEHDRIFTKDTIKNDGIQTQYYKTKLKTSDNLIFYIIYNIGGNHVIHSKDEFAPSYFDWEQSHDFWSMQKYYQLFYSNRLFFE